MGKTGLAAVMSVVLAGFSVVACAQPRPPETMGHRHGGPTLFLAQLDSKSAVPPRRSSATGTGAFLVDPATQTFSYDLTFHGLEYGTAKSIALRNFGAGGKGALIQTICGSERRPCPSSVSGNVTATSGDEDRPRLEGKLLSEFASARVYVEIVGGDGKAEIRGQLEPNGAMVPVRNFVAHLAPAPGVESRGAGTAVVSEVHFPDGRVSVFYRFTVAGTNGPPRNAALVGVSATEPLPRRRPGENVLPKPRLLPSRAPATGGTITGEYEVNRSRPDALFPTKVLSAENREIGIVVSTSRFPQGELFGVLKPVN
jgi:hypothetical protein